MLESLTSRQKQFLNYISQYLRANSKPPTLMEIAKALKVTESAAAHMLKLLQEKGIIERNKWAHRSINFKQNKVSTIPIPIVGSIACGSPIFAEENIDGYVSVDKSLVKGTHGYFFLKAVGDSMDNQDINDGDYLLIQCQEHANEGQTVVALIGHEATVKIFKPGKGFTALVPNSKNRNHKPIIMRENFQIQGIVKEVIPKELID